MKKAQHVAVTGAAGNIGYAILFRIAAGDLRLGVYFDRWPAAVVLEVDAALDGRSATPAITVTGRRNGGAS